MTTLSFLVWSENHISQTHNISGSFIKRRHYIYIYIYVCVCVCVCVCVYYARGWRMTRILNSMKDLELSTSCNNCVSASQKHTRLFVSRSYVQWRILVIFHHIQRARAVQILQFSKNLSHRYWFKGCRRWKIFKSVKFLIFLIILG